MFSALRLISSMVNIVSQLFDQTNEPKDKWSTDIDFL